MITLEHLIFFGGLVHLSTLVASAVVPKLLDLRREYAKLQPLTKEFAWVTASYIPICIVAFGLISISEAGALAAGSPLARKICFFIAFFWGVRLVIQLAYFRPKPYLTHWFLKAGYHLLTVYFLFHTVVYGYAALRRS